MRMSQIDQEILEVRRRTEEMDRMREAMLARSAKAKVEFEAMVEKVAMTNKKIKELKEYSTTLDRTTEVVMARTEEIVEEFLARKAKLLREDEMMNLSLRKKTLVKEENEEPAGKSDTLEIKNEEE